MKRLLVGLTICLSIGFPVIALTAQFDFNEAIPACTDKELLQTAEAVEEANIGNYIANFQYTLTAPDAIENLVFEIEDIHLNRLTWREIFVPNFPNCALAVRIIDVTDALMVELESTLQGIALTLLETDDVKRELYTVMMEENADALSDLIDQYLEIVALLPEVGD